MRIATVQALQRLTARLAGTFNEPTACVHAQQCDADILLKH
jgi:hypothetical protein